MDTLAMARRYVNQYSSFPYHITSRCPNREPFHLDLGLIWNILNDYLYLASLKYGLIIHSFVLMPNHFHLIASSPTTPIGEVMREFMTNSSREMNIISGRLNQNWGGRHFKCVLDKHIHYINTYKYVYQNPVRAKLCERAEDWKYSTLNGLVGSSLLQIPVLGDTLLFNPFFEVEQLVWLNKEISDVNCGSIKRALLRKTFKLPKLGSKRTNVLESERA